MADLGANVERLLRTVPGLEIAGVVPESGYTCGGSGADRSPGLKAERRAETVRRAMEPDIDALVTLYHGCHVQLSRAGEERGFRVVNWTDLLVRALGGEPRQDVLEGWRAAGEWRALVEASLPNLAANRVDVDPDWLASMLPDVFAQLEFKGGLEAFASTR
jgi:heterodisulfide reductase subunit D